MRTLLIFAVLGGVAFMAGWFTINRDDGQTTITINRDEIKNDTRAAITRGREYLNRDGEPVGPAYPPTQEGYPQYSGNNYPDSPSGSGYGTSQPYGNEPYQTPTQPYGNYQQPYGNSAQPYGSSPQPNGTQAYNGTQSGSDWQGYRVQPASAQRPSTQPTSSQTYPVPTGSNQTWPSSQPSYNAAYGSQYDGGQF